MSENSIYQLVTAFGSIVATGITLSKIFFRRVETMEKTFSNRVDSLGGNIEKIQENLSRIDKSLAVNTAFIDQILHRGEEKWELKRPKN